MKCIYEEWLTTDSQPSEKFEVFKKANGHYVISIDEKSVFIERNQILEMAENIIKTS